MMAPVSELSQGRDSGYDPNSHVLPRSAFKAAITQIKSELMGAQKNIQRLCADIKNLPLYHMPENGVDTPEVSRMYYGSAETERHIKGLILLLHPSALCGEEYPDNVRDFAKLFHVQEHDFSYLNHNDPSIGEEVKRVACEILGLSYTDFVDL